MKHAKMINDTQTLHTHKYTNMAMLSNNPRKREVKKVTTRHERVNMKSTPRSIKKKKAT